VELCRRASADRPGTGRASAADASRDYRLETRPNGAPLLSVFGGKITTFRKLAEQAVDWIAPALGRRAPGWTARPACPAAICTAASRRRAPCSNSTPGRTRQQQYAWLPPALLARYARAYGTRLGAMLAHCRTAGGPGRRRSCRGCSRWRRTTW
jgi:glycerol-3-phosphate dehydrogenase